MVAGRSSRFMKAFLCSSLILLFGPPGKCQSDPTSQPSAYHEPRKRAVLKGELNHIFCLAFSRDGKILAGGGLGDERVQLWDIAAGKVRSTFKGQGKNVYSVAFSPDGKILASAGGEVRGAGEIILWDLPTKKPRVLLQDPNDVFKSLAFNADGSTLAAGCLVSSGVRLLDVATGKERTRYTAHDPRGISSIAFSPDGKMLASAGVDGMVKVWEPAGAKEQFSFRASTGGGHAPVAFSPDGKMLACGCNSYLRINNQLGFLGEVKLWDIGSGKERARFQGHIGNLRAVAFSPDGKTLASGSMDQTVSLWDVATGKERATLRVGVVTCLAFSPDGTILAVGATDGTLKLWEISLLKNDGK
jgi:WD40 repeat protein